MTNGPVIFVALPLMDELENIQVLVNRLEQQTNRNFIVIVCINQPEAWWDNSVKMKICRNNQETIELLNKVAAFPMKIIDRSSPGKGWDDKSHGVGWARRLAMDEAEKLADENAVLLSLDGDTDFSETYFQAVVDAFAEHPEVASLAVPYYHRLTDDPMANRAILRYEMYMRNYAINMLRIANPYAFTALGSAMACTMKAYRRIGGMTPHKSGEDFYFMQKLRKYDKTLITLSEKVYPATRFSDRVFFGTGPAMIKGAGGDWTSYPVYDRYLFDEIKATYDSFPELMRKDVETPMTVFLEEKSGAGKVWQPLRQNSKSEKQFIKAATMKVDGLRILQYIKMRNATISGSDEKNLLLMLRDQFNGAADEKEIPEDLDFEKSPISVLDSVRNILVKIEESWQKKIMILL